MEVSSADVWSAEVSSADVVGGVSSADVSSSADVWSMEVVVGGRVVAVGGTDVLEGAVADGDVEAVVEADAVGGFVAEVDALLVLGGGVVAISLSTVKVARRIEVAPCRHFRTAVILCRPSASFAVSKA